MSGDILDLNPKLEKNNTPDDEQIYVCYEGLTWYHYACEYEIDGKQFCFDLWGTSMEDAMRRLKAIQENGIIVGQLHSEIDYDDV